MKNDIVLLKPECLVRVCERIEAVMYGASAFGRLTLKLTEPVVLKERDDIADALGRLSYHPGINEVAVNTINDGFCYKPGVNHPDVIQTILAASICEIQLDFTV